MPRFGVLIRGNGKKEQRCVWRFDEVPKEGSIIPLNKNFPGMNCGRQKARVTKVNLTMRIMTISLIQGTPKP